MKFSEDRDYVERTLAGEPDAFELLVRKYNRMAGAIAYGVIGDFHEAEDVVQDAFLKAYRSLGTLRDPDRFRPWFAGVVRSKALDALRRRPASPAAGFEASAELAGGGLRVTPSTEEEQAREELRQKVLEAVQHLPQEDRLVVVLKHMDGLSYREIAEITGASVSSVESRLFRARLTLRQKLDPTKT